MPDSSVAADDVEHSDIGKKPAFNVDLFEQFATRQLIGTAASVAVSFVVALVISDLVPPDLLAAWVGAHALLAAPAIWLHPPFGRLRIDSGNVGRLTILAVVWKAASGALWGALAFISYHYLPDNLQFFAAIAVAAMAVGGTSTLTAIPAAANAFAVLCFAPFISFWLISDMRGDATLGLLAILLCIVVIGTGRLAHRQILAVLQADRSRLQLSAEFEAARREWLALSDTADAFALFDRNSRLLLSNDRFARLMQVPEHLVQRGTPLAEIMAASRQPLAPDGPPDASDTGRQQTHSGNDDATESDRIGEYEGGLWLRRQLRRTQTGNYLLSFSDLTELAAIERRLSESEEQLRAVVENMPGSIVLKDFDLKIRLAAGRNYTEWAGKTGREVVGKRAADLVSPELARELEHKDRKVLETGTVIDVETETPVADGTTRKFVSTRFPVRNASGEMIGVGIINQDVTDQRQAEEHLRHAQKLEAVGQLTGGIAHDFNNLLTVVIGNLEMMVDHVGNDPLAERLRATALNGAERGAFLTQRLLSFSRRQELRPEPVDIGQRVAGILDLLRRTVPETIALEATFDGRLPHALVDPNQLESAIVNLIVNARDAIAGNGKISVSADTAELDEAYVGRHGTTCPAGHYVCVTVTDDGTGMPPETVDHAFEPFFTTKAVGAGSGLGLSMVHGFATQSGGHVEIDSALGQGTRVTMYLPIADEEATKTAIDPQSSAGEPTPAESDGNRHETILVVEDDSDLRDLVKRSLGGMGYRVLTAANGPTALEAIAGETRIDLLLSDVILPDGMLGPDIARELAAVHPDARILLMSGYTRDTFSRDGAESRQFELLQKPFTRKQLAARLRRLLDEPATATPSSTASAKL